MPVPDEYLPYDLERLLGIPSSAMGSDWARRALGYYDPSYGLTPPRARVTPTPVATPTPTPPWPGALPGAVPGYPLNPYELTPTPQPTPLRPPQMPPERPPLGRQVPRWMVDLFVLLQQVFGRPDPFWRKPGREEEWETYPM